MTLCSRALLLSSWVIGVIGGGLPAQADPIRVSGGLVSGTAAAGVQTYKGIPYAKPPVGDLRWRAPQPVANRHFRCCLRWASKSTHRPRGSVRCGGPEERDIRGAEAAG
jgi:hypothetical protein